MTYAEIAPQKTDDGYTLILTVKEIGMQKRKCVCVIKENDFKSKLTTLDVFCGMLSDKYSYPENNKMIYDIMCNIHINLSIGGTYYVNVKMTLQRKVGLKEFNEEYVLCFKPLLECSEPLSECFVPIYDVNRKDSIKNEIGHKYRELQINKNKNNFDKVINELNSLNKVMTKLINDNPQKKCLTPIEENTEVEHGYEYVHSYSSNLELNSMCYCGNPGCAICSGQMLFNRCSDPLCVLCVQTDIDIATDNTTGNVTDDVEDLPNTCTAPNCVKCKEFGINNGFKDSDVGLDPRRYSISDDDATSISDVDTSCISNDELSKNEQLYEVVLNKDCEDNCGETYGNYEVIDSDDSNEYDLADNIEDIYEESDFNGHTIKLPNKLNKKNPQYTIMLDGNVYLSYAFNLTETKMTSFESTLKRENLTRLTELLSEMDKRRMSKFKTFDGANRALMLYAGYKLYEFENLDTLSYDKLVTYLNSKVLRWAMNQYTVKTLAFDNIGDDCVINLLCDEPENQKVYTGSDALMKFINENNVFNSSKIFNIDGYSFKDGEFKDVIVVRPMWSS